MENRAKLLLAFFLVFAIILSLFSQHPDVSGEPVKVLVILAAFADVPPIRSVEYIRKLVFEEMNSYYKEVSFGKASIAGAITQWYTLPKPVSGYGSPSYPREKCPASCNQPGVRYS